MKKMVLVRALVALLLAALVAGVSAAPSGAAPANGDSGVTAAAATTHHSLAAALTYLRGKRTSGPNSYTHGQWATVTTMYADRNSSGCPNGYYRPSLALHSNTTVAAESPQAVAPHAAAGPCPQVAPDGVVAMSPWNPFSWDWGHIFGSAWSNIWNKCLSGATSGLVGTASSTLIVNLLARGGRVFVGPYGYAAIALGGCFANMLW